MTRAVGIDISKWQGAFDIDSVTAPLDFIIQKVSEGIAYDSRYWDMLPDVQEIERRGGYHYFRTAVSPYDQANFFNQGQGNQGFKFLVMDWEGKYNILDDKGMDAFWIFYQELRSLTTKPIWLYCTEYAFRALIKHNPGWIEVPFMVARYPGGDVDPQTDDPLFTDGEALTWIAWQWEAEGNGKGEEYGVSSEDIDMEVFHGTVEELDEHLNISVPVNPDPPVIPPVVDCEEQVALCNAECEKRIAGLLRVHELEVIAASKKANNQALQNLINPHIIP